jgi:ABC-type bacteriocin/lantibiotic exporter with double-glycine peptidase domain
VNVLRAFGVKAPEAAVMKLAETTSQGTGEQGVKHALRHYGLSVSDALFDRVGLGWEWLHGSLMHGRCVILCLDDWGHWSVALATLGDRVVVIDPMKTRQNMAENGVHVLSHQRLMRRWRGPGKQLYGISVGRG